MLIVCILSTNKKSIFLLEPCWQIGKVTPFQYCFCCWLNFPLLYANFPLFQPQPCNLCVGQTTIPIVLYCIVFQEVAHRYIVQSQAERALLSSAPQSQHDLMSPSSGSSPSSAASTTEWVDKCSPRVLKDIITFKT